VKRLQPWPLRIASPCYRLPVCPVDRGGKRGETSDGDGHVKNKSLGVVLIILGILVNNYAYLTDIIGNTHEGLIFMGWKGFVAAALGVLSVTIGVMALLRDGKNG
jgi:hypothetical protein